MSCSSASGETNKSSDRLETPLICELNIYYHIRICPPFYLNPINASSYHVILFYHLRVSLPSSLFPSGIHTKNLRELLSSIRAICPAYLIIFDLLSELTFPAEYTHTCPQLYLQMNRVMLHSVTNIHQTAILNRTAVLLLYSSKDIHYIWEKVKNFYFITHHYEAADLFITRKKDLLYCCCWYN